MTKINIIAEGDSWFSLPDLPPRKTSDVLVPFIKTYRNHRHPYRLVGEYTIPGNPPEEMYRHAHFGHTIKEMAKQKNLDFFRRIFKKKKPVKAMIFSGGGNDLIEKFIDPASNFLKPYKAGMSAANSLDKEKSAILINDIKGNYQKFIELCQGNEAILITHSYYPPDPTRGGYDPLFGIVFKGPWFEKAFDDKGYFNRKGAPLTQLRKNICKLLIEEHFIGLLEELKKGNPNDFDYVDLTQLKIKYEDRADEIHFSYYGCKKVAQAFVKKLDERLKPKASHATRD